MKKDKHPLELALQILEKMGTPGKWIWSVAKKIPDPAERLAYVKKAIDHVRSKAQTDEWFVPPVDFRTFVECEELLDNAGGLWPEVMKAGEELNSGKYNECVLTGGIGVGKSHLAIYTQAYQLYVLSCMKNPHAAFDLDENSAIVIIFQSISKDLAKDVDYSSFRSLIDNSPFFRKYAPFDKERLSDMRFIKHRIIVKPVAGHDTAAIGSNVIGGILDEINFMALTENSKMSRTGDTYDQATSNYNSIARRRESRFMALGELPGMLCLVSSRNYPGQFTDKKEAEAKNNPRIFVYDKRVWQVRPEKFSGQYFQVFIGDQTRKPRVIKDEERIAVGDRHLIMSIPVEYKRQFENDMLPSLRDIAGVATQALHPFMVNTDAVASCFGRTLSILSRDDCDFIDSKIQVFPKRIVNPNEPRLVHIDLSLTKDSAGFAMAHVPRFERMSRGDHFEILPVIQYDCILEVVPPRGGEIEIEKLRQLLYTLRDKLGIPVRWVSMDQFQSSDTRQILHSKGFMTGHQSMDSDTHAYDILKQALYDRRVWAPAHPKAMNELTTLEFNPLKNKVDHSPHGSKDISDAMAGVAIGLSMRREVWHRHNIPIVSIPRSITDRQVVNRNSLDAKEKAAGEVRLNG